MLQHTQNSKSVFRTSKTKHQNKPTSSLLESFEQTDNLHRDKKEMTERTLHQGNSRRADRRSPRENTTTRNREEREKLEKCF
ncbi:hypothetical protein Csa_014403 [Cucumis sativus]|uniref:Uncharacterized protein n=1 Tax=Cucumis sativus TaxID=3659 RepID=A0A0A0KTP6_CUCSA|nr:hypothetical protein Csa_014403 [Cucumis sativus]